MSKCLTRKVVIDRSFVNSSLIVPRNIWLNIKKETQITNHKLSRYTFLESKLLITLSYCGLLYKSLCNDILMYVYSKLTDTFHVNTWDLYIIKQALFRQRTWYIKHIFAVQEIGAWCEELVAVYNTVREEGLKVQTCSLQLQYLWCRCDLQGCQILFTRQYRASQLP